MESVGRELFRAIHEGLWASIGYGNRNGETTRYWIGIRSFDPSSGKMRVYGQNVGNFAFGELTVYFGRIAWAQALDGTYCPVNGELVADIADNPDRYEKYFGHIANLKILNYLYDCSRLDTTPYVAEHTLVEKLDGSRFENGVCPLSDGQFRELVRNMQLESKSQRGRLRPKRLCMNVLSMHVSGKGLYVLAYRALLLDVEARALRAAGEITVCQRFTAEGGYQLSARQFLDADDFGLLGDFRGNLEAIKDRLMESNRQVALVDDLPHVIALGFDASSELLPEYDAISGMFARGETTVPVNAFFGNMLRRPRRRKSYPIVLRDARANLDQLHAIDTALRYPLTYVQGPPGTGKTSTIVNTVLSLFFNGRTVLFASYNNHPIDGVFSALCGLKHGDRPVPFPVVRLGNREAVREAAERILAMYEGVKNAGIGDAALDGYREGQAARTEKLTELLKLYEEKLDLEEKRDAMAGLEAGTSAQMTFSADLKSRQRAAVEKRLSEIGEIGEDAADGFLQGDSGELYRYLYYESVRHIKRLGEPKYEELREVLHMEDADRRATELNRYLSDRQHLRDFLRIFPVVITTCISAHRLGPPEPAFDSVILDEASQCNIAVSLVPIVRGQSLMLVGDPQQLRPVILTDPKDSERLREKYGVAETYDYVSNSIYRAYLGADAVSEEILLREHYRCHPDIIAFNNRKYYGGLLSVKSKGGGEQPLVFGDVTPRAEGMRNASSAECEAVVAYVRAHPDEQIGVITPFVNQKNLISEALRGSGCRNAECGTVHSFQGDEKSVVLFSLALTPRTGTKTYRWLRNNQELINVAVSRARDRLVLLASGKDLERLHAQSGPGRDDIYELARYVRAKGRSKVTPVKADSRALGIKPYSDETEAAFLMTLSHALQNVPLGHRQCAVRRDVPAGEVFRDAGDGAGLFDFVVYDRRTGLPLFATETVGENGAAEVYTEEICRAHGLTLLRVESCYARRYAYIKEILTDFFAHA